MVEERTYMFACVHSPVSKINTFLKSLLYQGTSIGLFEDEINRLNRK